MKSLGWYACTVALVAMPPLFAQAPQVPLPAESAAVPCCPVPEECCSRGAVFAGAGIYLLQPRWHDNVAFSTLLNPINAAGVGTGTVVIQQQFEWDLSVAPTAWVGAVNDGGTGGRVRWFGFDHSTSAGHVVTGNSPTAAGPFIQPPPPGVVEFTAPLNSTLSVSATGATPNGTVLNVGSGLTLNVWDFEGIQTFEVNRYSGLVAVGVRYAHIAQNYNSIIVTPPIVGSPNNNAPSITDVFAFSHSFNGAGITVASENRYQVFGNLLGVYGNLRGSLLYGVGRQSSTLLTNNTSPSISNVVGQLQVNDLMPIGEMELGLETEGTLGRFTPFLQLGAVGQVWVGAGNASLRSSTIASAPVTSDQNLGLIGLRITGGIRY